MLLIADSGSTKTDWRLVNEEGKTIGSVQTQGLNPYFLTQEEITFIVEKEVSPIINGNLEKVFFYGAGCALPLKASQVQNALNAVIPARHPAEVAGDILGAARSILQDRPGITCILGTGANSCVYDGSEIVENVPSLGYILADWGSGTVMSKDLLSLLLQEKLTSSIIEDFQLTHGYDRGQILDSIYNKPMANRFLASFTPFLLKHSNDALCREIIINNFRNFFTYYVLRYKIQKENITVGIVGSIAWHFKEFLIEVASEMEVSIEEIVQNPMEGLIQYHCTTVPVIR
jgi:glucosamine kinase